MSFRARSAASAFGAPTFQRRNPGGRFTGGRRSTAMARLRAAPRARAPQPKAIRSENGFVDLASAAKAMNTTGSITLLATVAQGASVNQRIGRKVLLQSVHLRGQAQADSATLVANGAMLVVYDKRPQDSLPAITDILDTANSHSFRNHDNTGRFQVIRRKNWSFVGNSATAAQNTPKSAYVLDEFVKLGNRPFNFGSAGTGAIGDITTGALYLVTVGNVASGTGDAILTVGARTTYKDI